MKITYYGSAKGDGSPTCDPSPVYHGPALPCPATVICLINVTAYSLTAYNRHAGSTVVGMLQGCWADRFWRAPRKSIQSDIRASVQECIHYSCRPAATLRADRTSGYASGRPDSVVLLPYESHNKSAHKKTPLPVWQRGFASPPSLLASRLRFGMPERLAFTDQRSRYRHV